MRKLISKNIIEKALAKAEEALNLIGYVPMISLISAGIRFFGGVVQLITGICFALVYFFFLKCVGASKMKHFVLFKTSLSHALHGICNMFRSKIEAVPFLSLIICLPYDRLLKKRFKYEAELFQESEDDAQEIHI